MELELPVLVIITAVLFCVSNNYIVELLTKEQSQAGYNETLKILLKV